MGFIGGSGWLARCARTIGNGSKNIGIHLFTRRFSRAAVGRRVKSRAIDRRTWCAIQWWYTKKVVNFLYPIYIFPVEQWNIADVFGVRTLLGMKKT